MTTPLAEKILTGSKWAVARLISRIENQHPTVPDELTALYPHTGQAHLIGITGAPGTGKSSLVNELAKAYRQADKTVAILAVDPTSPFSGGAVLGDRIRMQDLSGDAGVFIRSMATRGSLGGLAIAANDALKVLDAAGYDIILIETVGAGQSEVDIVRTAHTVVVVEAPGLGDDVQAIKAGILEIADIFVVNKADRAGVERTVSSLKRMLDLGQPTANEMLHHGLSAWQSSQAHPAEPEPADDSWTVPIIKTVALKGEGLAEVVSAINAHAHHLQTTDKLTLRNRNRLASELHGLLQAELMKRLERQLSAEQLNQLLEQMTARTLAPHEAVRQIVSLG